MLYVCIALFVALLIDVWVFFQFLQQLQNLRRSLKSNDDRLSNLERLFSDYQRRTNLLASEHARLRTTLDQRMWRIKLLETMDAYHRCRTAPVPETKAPSKDVLKVIDRLQKQQDGKR